MYTRLASVARRRPYLFRLALTLTFSVIFVAIFNEATYLLQKEDFDRLPKTVSLVIPPGAAAQVAARQAVQGVPEEMVFVLGDVLEVKNEDSQAHNLGPLWIPPGGTARLVMENPNKYSYSCSFQPSQYLGLDVRQGTTLATRITAMLLAAPTLTALLFIYSLAVWPIHKEKTVPAAAPRQEAGLPVVEPSVGEGRRPEKGSQNGRPDAGRLTDEPGKTYG